MEAEVVSSGRLSEILLCVLCDSAVNPQANEYHRRDAEPAGVAQSNFRTRSDGDFMNA